MTKKCVTIGIDQSFTATAAVVINNITNEVIDFKVFKTDKEDNDVYDRASIISDNVCNLVDLYPNSDVIFEGLAFGMSGNATRDLAGLLFTLITNVRSKCNVKEHVLSPKSVKLFATGSGKASKSEMIESLPDSIKSIFAEAGFKKTTGLADLADAYWIAKLHQSKE